MDEDINEVVSIASDDETEAEKPIIQLFHRLTNEDKQSTVLTNAQIVDILYKEFDINISRLHELEGDIYLTIIKKCLKDWPRWDEFDRTVSKLKSKSDKASAEKFLKDNYINLKEHLRLMLDLAKESAAECVKQVIDLQRSKERNDSSESNVVLEIFASRYQLNQLFFRHPTFDRNIFNGQFTIPTQINLNTLSIDAILNWWDVSIGILSFTNVWFYKREMKHEFKHVLVNRNLLSRYNPLKVLDQDVKVHFATQQTVIQREELLMAIDGMYERKRSCPELLDFLKKDIALLPDFVYARSAYQRYTNKYPYVRYLCKEVQKVDKELKRYDLQLEETLSPKYETYIGNVQKQYKSIVVKCLACKYTIDDSENILSDLQSHFSGEHLTEPDWKCTNCNETFPMAHIAQTWWSHRC